MYTLKQLITTGLLFFSIAVKILSQDLDSAMKFFDGAKYEKAAEEFEKVLPLLEKIYGENDTSYYTIFLMYAAFSNEKCNQFEKAENYYLKIREIYRNLKDTSAYLYVTATSNLAELFRITGKFKSAEAIFKEAIILNSKIYGIESLQYMNMLNNLALFYRETGRYKEAEEFFIRAIDICRKLFSEDHPRYMILTGNLAALYHKMGNYVKAEPLYFKVLQFARNYYESGSPEIVEILNNLGAFYEDTGNYEKALELYTESLNIRAKTFGSGHPEYAIAANNLAQLYFKTGFFEKAEQLYYKALEIYGNTYGENHMLYASALNNLGVLYHNSGNFSKAEKIYSEALKIRKNILGEKHPDYANTLGNLALLYHELGNYERAETLYYQALKVREETTGESHPDYSVTLNNLALLYCDMSNFSKATVLFQKAAEIRENISGKYHPAYAVVLNNLALTYACSGNYDRAEKTLSEVIEIYEKISGNIHPDYATALSNLADIFWSKGNYEQSARLYLQALDIFTETAGQMHPGRTSVLSNLALLYHETGNINEASKYYHLAKEVYMKQIRQQFGFLSSSEKEKYITSIQHFFKTYQNFIFKALNESPFLATEAYDIELAWKSLILHADKQMRMAVLESGDSGIIKKFDSWLAAKASLARQYSLPLSKRNTDVQLLEEQAENLEKELTRFFSDKGILRSIRDVKWQDIRRCLKPDEAAIEYTYFPWYNGRKWTDSIYYCAIVVRNNFSYPIFIPLFEEKQLDSLLVKDKGSDESYIDDLYAWNDYYNPGTPGKGKQIFELLWKPVEKYLEGVKRIYYSPTGRLHQLSFSAIPVTENEILSDIYDLHQMISTAEITENIPDKPSGNIVLYGGINYGQQPPVEMNSGHEKRGNYLMFLDGTLTEIQKIKKIAEDKGFKTIVFSGDNATEPSLRNLSIKERPGIFHFATHGFFLQKADSSITNLRHTVRGYYGSLQTHNISENPLMRSGLALTGANMAWGSGEIFPDSDDGILTAYEVSNLYFPGTILAVLSACETGLGEIKGSEGVYGLQRSFKIAGVNYIIMSLWKVPDYQTSELMTLFYSEWFSGKSVKDAFSIAQSSLRKRYPRMPFMWAGFVIVR